MIVNRPERSDSYIIEGFRFDRGTGELFRLGQAGGETPVAIGSRALNLLGFLIEQRGKLVSKDDLMSSVWGGAVVEESNLSVQISTLRRILDRGRSEGSCIQTVSGRGYRFTAAATPAGIAAGPDVKPVPSIASTLAAPVDGGADASLPDDHPSNRLKTANGGDRAAFPSVDGELLELTSPAAHPPLRPSRFRLARPRRFAIFLALVLPIAAALAVAANGLWRDYWEAAPRGSIMVLPFTNLSNDPSEDYFADAVTVDVTTDLSRLHDAFVIAPATAFTYKGKNVDPRQIGRECRVRYILTGSIRRIGTRIETDIQLIDAQSGGQLWADRFENEVTGLLELEAAVTGRIASSLGIQLLRAEGSRAANERGMDPDALDLRLRATALWVESVTPASFLKARRLLEKSVRLDPHSAESWAWLGNMLASDYLNRWNDAGKDQLEEAETAVQQALTIDPDLALAYYAKGYIHRARGEHIAAVAAFERATELDPNFARAYAQEGNELIQVGRPQDAPALVEKAMRLSPLDPSHGVFYWIMGRAYFYEGKYREAIPWLRQSVEIQPFVWYNRLYLVSACALSGEEDEAKRALAEFNDRPQFGKYTLAHVQVNERASPTDDALGIAARQKFHEGLLTAGMAAH